MKFVGKFLNDLSCFTFLGNRREMFEVTVEGGEGEGGKRGEILYATSSFDWK